MTKTLNYIGLFACIVVTACTIAFVGICLLSVAQAGRFADKLQGSKNAR